LNKGVIAVLAGVFAVALFVAGCGSDSSTTDSTTASITKAEFVKQGNAICKEGNEKIESEFEKFGKENNLSEKKAPTEAQIEEAAEQFLIPQIRNQVEGLRALGAPSGEEEKVNALLDNAESALDEVEEDPSLLSGQKSEPFEDVNKEARAVGLTTCGEE
jgi:hypothetical protein